MTEFDPITLLSIRQQRFVRELFNHRTFPDVCRAAGIGEKTGRRWLRQPAVQAAVRAMSDELMQALVHRLRQLGHTAADVLAAALAAREAPWMVRVRAADVTLSQLLKVTELADLERRVAALEAVAKEAKERTTLRRE